ncbi:MAG: hypothetical protein GIW99_06455 [Candidatus Eremiobacteraeota bacterium]|nr:hypothetical protein [Candidatus Eremiobacteraeota bacterium]MBC5827308.1 hypothetical protein [Candidatus Eremiobacteraeota bacterium]
MPIEPRIFIKTGIAYLFLTFLAGAIMTIMEATGHAVPRVFEVEHGHMGFVGWLVNVVVGVALWMFPLDRTRFAQTSGRYPTRTVWLCYACLNIGLPLRLVAEPWYQLGGGHALSAALLVASGVLQVAAVTFLACIVWIRVHAPRAPAPGVR